LLTLCIFFFSRQANKSYSPLLVRFRHCNVWSPEFRRLDIVTQHQVLSERKSPNPIKIMGKMRAPLAVLLLVVGTLAESTRHGDTSSARQVVLKISRAGGTRRTSSSGIVRSSSAGTKHLRRLLEDSNAPTSAEPTAVVDDALELPSSRPSVIEDEELVETPTVQQLYPSAAPTLNDETPGSDESVVPSEVGDETPVPTEGRDETPAPTESKSGVTSEPSAGPTPTPSRSRDQPTRPTKPQYAPPTERPTGKYIPPDDDPVKQEEEEEKEGGEAEWSEQQESLEQLERDQRVLIALAVIGGFVLLMLICLAHQLLENPDGCCAR
jgi:hypothetical protein